MYLYVCMNAGVICFSFFLKKNWLIIYIFIIKFLFYFKCIHVFAWDYMLVYIIIIIIIIIIGKTERKSN